MRRLCLCLALLLLPLSVFSVEVNKTELEEGQSDAVQFENYGGAHTTIDSAAAIIGIGTALGDELARDLENPQAIQPYAKYSLYHVVGSDEDGLDADILFLNETAGVDHIDNLRRILAGYLMAAYAYTEEDARTLSIFITVYNAVYRGNLENFSEKYKNSVLTYLDAQSVGLSTSWEDWAGKTQIVVPLGELAGKIGAVETSVISDDKVIEALRADEGKNIEARENLVGIKEKEADNAGERAKSAQKDAAQARKDGDNESVRKNSKTAAEQQQIADRKTEEIKTEREQIAKDKEDVKKSEAAQTTDPSLYFTSLFVADEKNKLYSLITLNPKDGAIIKRSNLRQIRERTIYSVSNVAVQKDDKSGGNVSEAFIAVCGGSAVRLCLIDSESLEILKQSEETLSENSSLVQQGEIFYVIVSEGGKNYLAAYDKNLTLKNKSGMAINGASPLNFYSGGILVTDEKGNPALLSVPELSSVW